MDEATAQAIEISIANEAVAQVGFKRLSPDAVIPTKAHPTDSGFDLVASADVIIEPGATIVVPTGIAVQLPAGFEATVRPRSGVTSKSKLRVQLGTIDNGYNAGIGVIIDNIADTEYEFNEIYGGEGYDVRVIKKSVSNSDYLNFVDGSKIKQDEGIPEDTYFIRKGDRIAQLVITRLPDVEAIEVFDVGESSRGAKGFGSSGVSEE